MKITTYLPRPVGSYQKIQLRPRDLTNDPLPCNASMEGTLVMDASDNLLKICGSRYVWEEVNSVWMREGVDEVVPVDGASDPSLRLGIGTTSPDLKLTVKGGGVFAEGGDRSLSTQGGGIRMFWYPLKAAFRAGGVNWNQWNDVNIGQYSAVGGGEDNKVVGDYGVIGGGSNNSIGDISAGFILGGSSNAVSGDFGSILGGSSQSIQGQWSAIGGGRFHAVDGNYSAVIGGYSNTVTGNYAVIGAGYANTVEGDYSLIGAGRNNKIVGAASVIGGGRLNSIDGQDAFIGGGLGNQVRSGSLFSGIVGGKGNEIDGGTASVIIGGESNTISGGNYSVILGGKNNKISGHYAVVLTGSDNVVDGEYSVAAGRNMYLTTVAARTFVWGYAASPKIVYTPEAAVFYCDQEPVLVGVSRPDPQHPMHFASGAYVSLSGDFCTATGTCLDTLSDKRLKRDVQPLKRAMDLLKGLQGVSFYWKDPKRNDGRKEEGFIAQDVERVLPQWVRVNADQRRILDMKGVSALILGGIKNIYTELKRSEAAVKKYKRQVADLRRLITRRQRRIFANQKILERQEQELRRLRSE